jgi:hypothetical protein
LPRSFGDALRRVVVAAAVMHADEGDEDTAGATAPATPLTATSLARRNAVGAGRTRARAGIETRVGDCGGRGLLHVEASRGW